MLCLHQWIRGYCSCTYVGMATAQILHANLSEVGDQKKSSTNHKSALRTFRICWIECCSCRSVGRATAQILPTFQSFRGGRCKKKVPQIAKSHIQTFKICWSSGPSANMTICGPSPFCNLRIFDLRTQFFGRLRISAIRKEIISSLQNIDLKCSGSLYFIKKNCQNKPAPNLRFLS